MMRSTAEAPSWAGKEPVGGASGARLKNAASTDDRVATSSGTAGAGALRAGGAAAAVCDDGMACTAICWLAAVAINCSAVAASSCVIAARVEARTRGVQFLRAAPRALGSMHRKVEAACSGDKAPSAAAWLSGVSAITVAARAGAARTLHMCAAACSGVIACRMAVRPCAGKAASASSRVVPSISISTAAAALGVNAASADARLRGVKLLMLSARSSAKASSSALGGVTKVGRAGPGTGAGAAIFDGAAAAATGAVPGPRRGTSCGATTRMGAGLETTGAPGGGTVATALVYSPPRCVSLAPGTASVVWGAA